MGRKLRWTILMEDEDVLVVDKPAGWLSIPDRFDKEIPNLQASLTEYRGKVFVCHRLDRDTSGLIVFAKNEEAHKKIQDQFENREVDKIYLAIVQGVLPLEEGRIELGISRHPSGKKMMVDEKGKNAISYFRQVHDWVDYSLVQLKIETGRTHQIRVHMAELHCPLLCDKLYGHGGDFFLSSIKKKYKYSNEREERPLLSRVALHAEKLSFTHPTSGDRVSLESPIPKDLRATINQLKKNFG